MRVIICGAGTVGFSLARYLSTHDNHVTVIDSSHELITRLNDRLDVKAILGHASHREILQQAGADQADMVIAVTGSDEINMIACKIAHTSFQIPTKIARIRAQSYLNASGGLAFDYDEMPIDVVISPETEVAHAISRSLTVPGSFDNIPLADGRVNIIGVRCTEDTPIVNTPIRHIQNLFQDLDITIIAIIRDDHKFIPLESDLLLAQDQIFFAVDAGDIGKSMAAFGFETKERRRLVILGGGNIGLRLAQEIEQDHPNVQAEIIEQDKTRAEFIAQYLHRTVVLCGDGLDSDVLKESRIMDAETMVAVTDDDRVNGLAAVLAKRLGALRSLCLLNNTTHNTLFTSLGIDGLINPQKITISRILHHVRIGRIRSIHSMGDDFGEIIEAQALETSGIVGTLVHDLNVPGEIIIAALVRDNTVIIPSATTTIAHDDRVILMARPGAISKIEKMFAARLDYY